MKCLKNFVIFLWVVVDVSGQSQPVPPPISATPPPPNCCKEGYWYSKDADKCYKFHEDRAIWTRALNSCMEEGATLAVLNNSQEQKAIQELFRQQGEYPRLPRDIKESAFVGIVKRKTGVAGESGEFYNIYTNQKINDGFAPWAPGEPNNLYYREDCGTVNHMGNYYDDPCYEHLEYICESNKICS